jgi:Family of unknown function (DUF6252)
MKPLMLLLFPILLSGCKKDEGLTKATQEGANTFSCKVDGKLYKAQIEGISFSGATPITVHNFETDGFTLSTIDSRVGESVVTRILIQLPYLQTTGSYELSAFPSYGQYKLNYSTAPLYRTNATHTGVVNISRCDVVKEIYSGTFSFTAVDQNTGEVIKITDGRFDVKR